MVTGDDIRGTSSRFVVLIHKLQRPFESPPFTRTEVDPVGRWASWRTAPPLSAWTGKGVTDNWGFGRSYWVEGRVWEGEENGKCIYKL